MAEPFIGNGLSGRLWPLRPDRCLSWSLRLLWPSHGLCADKPALFRQVTAKSWPSRVMDKSHASLVSPFVSWPLFGRVMALYGLVMAEPYIMVFRP